MLRRNLTQVGACKYQAKYKRAALLRCNTRTRDQGPNMARKLADRC
jgi:hypothetical protein